MTLDVVERQSSDGNAGARSAVKVTTVVVLLEEDTILGDVGESDILVGDFVDLSGLGTERLDAHAVGGLGDLAVGEGHGVNGVVIAAANGADGQTVAARAKAVLEGDLLGVGLAIVLTVPIQVGLTVPEFTATQSSWL